MEDLERLAWYWRGQDPAAVEWLLKHYDYLVSNSVSKISNADRSPAERDDCLQEGRLGLLKAIREFDPTAGFQFSSFAIPAIRGHAEEWLRQKATFVKRPGQDKKKALAKARELLERIGIDDPDERQLKAAVEEVLKKKVNDFADWLDAADLPTLLELDAPTGEEESLADHVQGRDDFAIEESRANRLRMERAIHRIRPALHRHVLGSIIEDGLTPRQAAKLYGISPLVADGIRRKSLTRARRLLNQPPAENGKQKPASSSTDIETIYRVDPPTKKALATWAEKRGVSRKEAVRWLVSDYLQAAAGRGAGR